ncbi:PrsW family glutamic-type intramembrane protease [Mycolicibacterium sp.]|uniref:PrsW family intramembrane metalloprotease n=1 Tax=Mycolicibacterium sp. TaxID=2320850 RepID=UPI001D206F06|nr:PrsW family glutamic-type intramembrane protease [Mycolicibacterium sp.]MCB1291940.1 PrsW family intramembrane metalloprotease [Mycobacterium sp.]MCB9408058.1 PrsW family intramembrane metalloprotease [Mycolicibacterium sp.]MCB9424228.1 PrsW family intramembrane metalloprotease [Actinomycetota bacterium]
MSAPPTPPLFTIPPPASAHQDPSVWPLRVVYLAGVLSGAAILLVAFGPSAAEVPTLTGSAVIGFGLFGAVCGWLLSRISDFGTVAPSARWLALCWGAFAAIGYPLLANRAIRDHFAARGDGESWSLLTPFTEEPAKLLGIFVVLLLAATRPRSALDGLVVGSFVGLGFEVVENIARSINNAITSYPPGQRDNLGSLTVDLLHEVVRGSWSGHIVITGIAGFGVGYAMTAGDRSGVRRWAVAVSLVALAVAGHLLWNSHRFGAFYVLGQVGLFVFFLWLIRVGRRREAEIYLPYLGYVTPSVIEAGIRRSRTRRRVTSELAAAIGTGDAQRAHRCIQRLVRDGSGQIQPRRVKPM